MGWLKNLFTGSAGSLIKNVGDVVDNLTFSGEEKEEFKIKVKEMVFQHDLELQKSLQTELQTKERILVAELAQGDNYTKRARPTVVYAGLIFIFLNYCFIPVMAYAFGQSMPPLELPTAFWAGWSGIVSTWSIGRTFEKRGSANKAVKTITGNKSLLDI